MHLINAIVRPAKVAEVTDALQSFGFHGFTVIDAIGFGKQRGQAQIYRGAETSPEFQHKSQIEIVAPDDDVQDIVDVICKVAATGRNGDGKIWITPITEVIRIRTKQAGADAL